ncbi:enoyl-CoA hydratase-related protein [Kribbella qitaiheensis]|uniref:enoyl-CoA hydratase-related protein n=1 Tax=Kribbella qitaiheensis TaxID=1544730 RepID=UPI003610A595
MEYENIIYETVDRVARITLNRPEYRNALSRPLQEELDHALQAAMADDGIGAVILAANGKMFSAGHDLGTPQQKQDLIDRPKLEPELRGDFQFAFDTVLGMPLRWRDLPKPTIAQVHGLCIFGGWKVAAAMDIIVASDDARFIPGPPQWMSLPWDIGARRAKAILLDDQSLTAEQAHEMGIVYKIWPREELEEQTLALAAKIAARPPFLLQMTKLAVNQAQESMGYRAGALASIGYRALHHASGEQKKLQEGERRQIPSVARILATDGGVSSNGAADEVASSNGASAEPAPTADKP